DRGQTVLTAPEPVVDAVDPAADRAHLLGEPPVEEGGGRGERRKEHDGGDRDARRPAGAPLDYPFGGPTQFRRAACPDDPILDPERPPALQVPQRHRLVAQVAEQNFGSAAHVSLDESIVNSGSSR